MSRKPRLAVTRDNDLILRALQKELAEQERMLKAFKEKGYNPSAVADIDDLRNLIARLSVRPPDGNPLPP